MELTPPSPDDSGRGGPRSPVGLWLSAGQDAWRACRQRAGHLAQHGHRALGSASRLRLEDDKLLTGGAVHRERLVRKGHLARDGVTETLHLVGPGKHVVAGPYPPELLALRQLVDELGQVGIVGVGPR